MNAYNEEQEVVTNSAYNPFPEPQTIPSGWDMSEFVAAPTTNAELDESPSVDC